MNTNNLEIEKKFLIKYPDTEYLKSISEYTDIEQIYLESENGVSERIRKRGRDGNYLYYHTVKIPVTDMTRIEDEHIITPEEYDKFKKRADKKYNIIYKTRYVIDYEGHALEIDVFPFWKKQAYLEIELAFEDEEFFIPDFIKVIRDVTEDRIYTNRALALKIPREI
jgi:CYTH domain-containing protein